MFILHQGNNIRKAISVRADFHKWFSTEKKKKKTHDKLPSYKEIRVNISLAIKNVKKPP